MIYNKKIFYLEIISIIYASTMMQINLYNAAHNTNVLKYLSLMICICKIIEIELLSLLLALLLYY